MKSVKSLKPNPTPTMKQRKRKSDDCPTGPDCLDCGNDCPGYNWGPNVRKKGRVWKAWMIVDKDGPVIWADTLLASRSKNGLDHYEYEQGERLVRVEIKELKPLGALRGGKK